MSKSIACFVLLSAAFGSLSLYLWNDARSAREREAALETMLRQTDSDRKAALADADAARARLQAFLVREQRSATPAVSANGQPRNTETSPALTANRAAAPAPEPVTAMMEERRRRMQDPEYIAALQAQRKFAMQRQYADFAAFAGLTREEEERLLEILSRRPYQPGAVVYQIEGSGQPLPGRAPEPGSEVFEAELTALLGAERYEKFLQYQRTAPAHADMREFRLRLGSQALSDAQYQSVVSVVAAEKERFFAESHRQALAAMQSGDMLSLQQNQTEHFEQYVRHLGDAVAPHLTPAQLETFRRMYQERVEMLRSQAILSGRHGVNVPDATGTISMSIPGGPQP